MRAIVANPVYTGVRVWGKQEKFEELIDADDVGAGNVTRMRWRDRDSWVIPVGGPTHEALVSDDVFDAAQKRLSGGPTRSRSTKPRESLHAYPLRGLLFCACGTRMQGSFRAPSRTLYRCELGKMRSIPAELADHPKTAYLNQADVLPTLDGWIAETFGDPRWLADEQEASSEPPELVSLRVQHREVEAALGNLMSVLERGLTSDAVLAQLRRREAEQASLAAQIAAVTRPTRPFSDREMSALIERVGGIASALTRATDAERSSLYTTMGLRLEFQPQAQIVSATVDLGRVAGCVRRGT